MEQLNLIAQISKRTYSRREPYSPSKKQVKKLLRIKDLYDKEKTLQKVADKLGVTRERVRQLLRHGEEYGLFSYEISRKKQIKQLAYRIKKEMLIEHIKNETDRKKTCLDLGVEIKDFYQLIEFYKIDLRDYRIDARQRKYLKRYTSIVDAVGHHPSTTEMNNKRWRATWVGIDRIWGGIENFRSEFGIEKPKFAMHPNTILAFKKSKEKLSAHKKERIEKLKIFIKNHNKVNFKMLREGLLYSPMSINSYLNELVNNGEVYKIKNSHRVWYVLVK